MTFAPTNSNRLDHYHPYENRGHIFGDDLASLYQPTKIMQSPLVNHFVPDHSRVSVLQARLRYRFFADSPDRVLKSSTKPTWPND